MKTMLRLLVAAGIVAAAMLVPVTGLAGESVDETVEMTENGLVRVENLAGKVEFIGWDRSEVQIRGELGDHVEELEITPTSTGVTIRVRNSKNKRNVDGTDLYLRIPESASIEADSVSADMTVSENRGESILLNTVSGDLEIEASPQKLE
ncbi:MAG: hypothetical protein KJO92_07975, partial [Gammaproteobacteria bacterium]|nr:hypothetical protein [Gammaproteobacteria bacterium]